MSNDHLRKSSHIRPDVRNFVGRLVSRVRKAPGSAPGTLVHAGLRKTDSVLIRMIDFDQESLEERQLERIEDCFANVAAPLVTWVNVDGLHDASVLEAVGPEFGIHRLALEDVLSTSQRPKVEEYGGHFLIFLKMLFFEEETQSIISEQVSFIVGPGYVLSFQERPGDVFEPVRERLRHGKGSIRARGADYLAYALVDAVVDSYFVILEAVGDRLEELEDAVFADPSIEVMQQVHHLRREMLILRRSVWPLRETLGLLSRGDISGVTHETQVFFRYVGDHAVQVIDAVETLREVLSGVADLYMSGVSNRMNEVMKVLTIISTIFIPLSFFAGLYGMNFEYMPELGIRWAYPALLAVMTALASGMLWFFRRRRWL